MPKQRRPRRLSRRDFVRLSATSAAALALGQHPLGTAFAAKPGPPTRYPLFIPPTVSHLGLNLNPAPAVADLGGGRLSNVWAYNGTFPGPTILSQSGDSVVIDLQNGLMDETTIHWHGMMVPHLADGHPLQAVSPGGGYSYQFEIQQRACLNWYHPHPHMLTGEQVALGAAGVFIVRDAQEASLGLPSGAYEVPLIIRDAKLNSSGNIVYVAQGGGYLGSVGLVNGTRDAKLDVDTAIYRFRVLNGANARIFGLALGNGAPLTLIGNDGGLLPAAVQVAQVDIAPSERVDLLVDLRQAQVGNRIMLRDLRAGWNLLELVVTRQVAPSGTLPTTLFPISPLTPGPTTRNFSFDGMSRINGQVFDMNRVDFQVPFGQVERWRFTTNGNAPHPVHVHGAFFQVQSRVGGRGALFPWETGWKDTVLLEDGETVEVLIRFDHHLGLYLLHCHKLEHEDMGMMANFEVI